MSEDLKALLNVTSLMRERALEGYRRDRAEETGLAAELGRIDAMRQAAHAQTDSLDTRRLMGADTLWQGWLARRRGEINREIALSRAKQAHSLVAARKAFSRDEAARSLVEQSRTDLAEARYKREERTLEDLSHLFSRDADP